jgi:hypothetical protein
MLPGSFENNDDVDLPIAIFILFNRKFDHQMVFSDSCGEVDLLVIEQVLLLAPQMQSIWATFSSRVTRQRQASATPNK